MPPDVTRRTILAALGSSAVGFTGCLSKGRLPSDDSTDVPTSTVGSSTPVSTPTVSADNTRPPEETGTFVPEWENPKPDKDHDVVVENQHTRAHTVDLRITHDDTVVFSKSIELAAGAKVVPYNFVDSPLDGIVDYVVDVTLDDGQTDRTTFTTDSCHGWVLITVSKTGELRATYVVC